MFPPTVGLYLCCVVGSTHFHSDARTGALSTMLLKKNVVEKNRFLHVVYRFADTIFKPTAFNCPSLPQGHSRSTHRHDSGTGLFRFLGSVSFCPR